MRRRLPETVRRWRLKPESDGAARGEKRRDRKAKSRRKQRVRSQGRGCPFLACAFQTWRPSPREPLPCPHRGRRAEEEERRAAGEEGQANAPEGEWREDGSPGQAQHARRNEER